MVKCTSQYTINLSDEFVRALILIIIIEHVYSKSDAHGNVLCNYTSPFNNGMCTRVNENQGAWGATPHHVHSVLGLMITTAFAMADTQPVLECII